MERCVQHATEVGSQNPLVEPLGGCEPTRRVMAAVKKTISELDCAQESKAKAEAMLKNYERWIILEIATLMDAARLFVEKTYVLEGDGFLAPVVFDLFEELK